MSFSGGVFSINTAGQPVVTGTTITSTAFNLLTADLATGLSTAMLKDGTQTATAGIGFYPGTVSLPGIYLGSDTATGLYRIGLNNTGYSINGTKLLDLSNALVGITGALTVSTTLNVTGATTLSAALTYGGVTLNNAVTGTGNMVLSASPTLTGNVGVGGAGNSYANQTTVTIETSGIVSRLDFNNGGVLKGAILSYPSIGESLRLLTNNTDPITIQVNNSEVGRFATTGLSVTGTVSATQSITAQGATTLATGAGVEVIYSAGQGYVQSYNRTGSAYTVLNVSGSTTNIQASGSTIGAFSSTGLSVTGTLSTTNSANSNAFTATQTSNNGNWAGIFVNSAATATNQYGVQITLSGDPNDATRNFLQGVGTVTERFTLRSNGGLANFSANNVNLSDLTVKPKFELYGEAGVMPSLWEAHKRMRGAWGRFKYDDQTHDDWNYGYGAQLVAEAFAHVAPELVDWWDDKKKLKAVYATDLANITGAIVTEVQYRVDYHEEKIAELLSWKAKAETALASAGITVE